MLHLAAPEATETAAAPATPRTAMRRSRAPQEAELPASRYCLVVEQVGHVSRSQVRVQH